MLRRVNDLTIEYIPKRFSNKGIIRICIGKSLLSQEQRMGRHEFVRQRRKAQTYPVCIASTEGKTYWEFQDKYYWDNDDLDGDQIYALLTVKHERERKKIENAQAIVSIKDNQESYRKNRNLIPDDVKQLVFVRDEGVCQHCGSNSELQFDHIIPVAKGGGSQEENIQLLCGPCNRQKGSKLNV